MCEQEPKARFINTTVHTRRHMQRAYQAAMPLWLKIILAALVLLVLSVFGASLAIHLSSGGAIALPLSAILALGYTVLLAVYVFYLRNWLGARRYERMNQELHPGITPQVSWHFYADHATAQSNLSEKIERIDYDNIIRVKETKEDFLLFRRMRLFYHLEKAGFNLGEAADFGVFLQEKIPSAKFQLKK